MKIRSSKLNRVDKTLQYQVETENEYWKNIRTGFCAVMKSLSCHLEAIMSILSFCTMVIV